MTPRTPAQVNRNTIILVVSFFLYIIISSLILMNIENGEFASKPVWEAVFGRSFVIGHLGAVTGLLFLFVGIFILNRTGHIKTPFRYYQEKEKNEFFKKYSFYCNPGETKSRRRFLYAIMIISTFLPGVAALSYWFLTGSDDFSIPVIAGTIVMFVLFYRTLFSLMKKDDKNIHAFFERVNESFDATSLHLKNYGMQNSVVSNYFSIALEGTYMGRRISLGNSTSGYTSGRNMRVNSRTEAALEVNSNANIVILKASFENTKRNVQAIPLIKYSGDTERLNFRARELIENFDRPLKLEIRDRKLSYEAKDFDIIPFYTMEGIILFLDFLYQLAREIESSPYV